MEAHAPICTENPRNRCFCGRVFPNSVARDNHATTCEMNPINRHECPHCSQEFVTLYGVTGLFRTDGRALRDAHVLGCASNPANRCFCGQLFSNSESRNAHALKCESNPANCFECQYCDARFVTKFNLLGFCATDGRALRDAHQLGCERNPRNVCFCGVIFPNQIAKERHAAVCEINPANRFQCPHCARLFITRYGVMGLILSNGKAMRDAHELRCDQNPANSCFCGQRFASPDLRDAHAAKCAENPVNRFGCQHCGQKFVTKFGVWTVAGSVERDMHMLRCKMNPANVTCEHCDTTFTDSQGWLRWFDVDAQKRCMAHQVICSANPENVCHCNLCGRRFVSGYRWFRVLQARALRDEHQRTCDVIPCAFDVLEADRGWFVLTEDTDRDEIKPTPAIADVPVSVEEASESTRLVEEISARDGWIEEDLPEEGPPKDDLLGHGNVEEVSASVDIPQEDLASSENDEGNGRHVEAGDSAEIPAHDGGESTTERTNNENPASNLAALAMEDPNELFEEDISSRSASEASDTMRQDVLPEDAIEEDLESAVVQDDVCQTEQDLLSSSPTNITECDLEDAAADPPIAQELIADPEEFHDVESTARADDAVEPISARSLLAAPSVSKAEDDNWSDAIVHLEEASPSGCMAFVEDDICSDCTTTADREIACHPSLDSE